MSSAQYSSNASFDLFKDSQTLYGFSKPEYGFFDMSLIFAGKDGPDYNSGGFTTAKANIIRFCQLCVNSVKLGTATFGEKQEGLLHLELIDGPNAIDIHLDVPIRGEVSEFYFNPQSMLDLLKVIPSDDVYFWPKPDRQYITDKDRTFIGVIMKYKPMTE